MLRGFLWLCPMNRFPDSIAGQPSELPGNLVICTPGTIGANDAADTSAAGATHARLLERVHARRDHQRSSRRGRGPVSGQHNACGARLECVDGCCAATPAPVGATIRPPQGAAVQYDERRTCKALHLLGLRVRRALCWGRFGSGYLGRLTWPAIGGKHGKRSLTWQSGRHLIQTALGSRRHLTSEAT